MNKAYILAICMLGASFTGCIEDDDSLTLRQSVEDFLQATEDRNGKKFCGYLLNYDGTFISGEDKQECIAMVNEDSGVEYAITIQAFDSEKQDYKVNKNSGYVYSVSMTTEVCYREQSDTQNGTNEWICETMTEYNELWVEVSGKWGYGPDGLDDSYSLEQRESAPIATFFVEESSGGYYYAEVTKVSRQDDLAEFSFFLKDGSGSTYVGGNGFGEIAMQFQGGEEHGIDMAYRHFGSNDTLANRSLDIYNDDGSIFPVHFADNDLDGNLSYGDEFLAYGEPGPVEGGWKLEIQHDITNYIVASAKLGEAQVQVYGCIHTNAINYNENANKDDGSCVYPVVECELVPYGHCSGEDLGGQDLSEMNLTGIDLSGANLTGANLTDANLRYAYLEGANLSGANLTDANLANASLSDANMSGAWLYTADLSGAWLDTADLTNAYLRFANLTDANLTSTDLFEARLIGALLKRADLTNADLTNADLVYGWLGFANFTGAIVTDVDFTYAYWEETIWTDGVVYDCTGLCDSPS